MFDWNQFNRKPVSLSRREFVHQLAGLAVAAAVPSSSGLPKTPQARLSVTSYPFRAYIESPTNRGRDKTLKGMDLKEFPTFVVEHFGVYNINPLIDHFASTDEAYLHDFVKAVAAAQSHVVDLGLPGGAFYSTDSAEREKAIASGRKGIDVAAAIGSPSVRPHVRGAKGVQPDVKVAAEALGTLAEYGGSRGVVVNLENDDPVAEDPFFLARVIEQVNSPWLRGLPDFGNSRIGHDAQYNERAVTAMMKSAFNMCHVKDLVQSDDGTPVHVDLPPLFAIAKRSGYRGYFSMESDGRTGDAFAGTKSLVSQTLRYLS